MSDERELDLAKVSSLLRSSLARIVRDASVCEVTMDSIHTMDSIQRTRGAEERSERPLERADDLIRRTDGHHSN